jgi:hypothetical protein
MFVLFYVIHLTVVANYTREFCFLPLSMIHTYLFVWDSFTFFTLLSPYEDILK